MIEWWESLTLLQQIFTCILCSRNTNTYHTIYIIVIWNRIWQGDGDAGDISSDFDSDIDTDISMADIGDIDGSTQFDVNAASDFDPDTSGGDINDTSGLSLFTIRGIVAFFL